MRGQIELLADWLSKKKTADAASRRPILVASPPSYLRRNMLFLIQQRGYDVAVVETGKALISEAHALRPELVLVDAQLPDQSGFEACATLRDHSEMAGLPAVMFTLHPDDAFHARAMQIGAYALMRFPAQSEELLETLDYALAGLPIEGQPIKLTISGDRHTVDALVLRILGSRSLQLVLDSADAPSNYLYRHATVNFEYEDSDHSQVVWQAEVVKVGPKSSDLRLTKLVSRQPRRQAVRKDVPLRASVTLPSGAVALARVLNLSVAGMLVAELPEAARVGDLYDFRVEVGALNLAMRGVVRRAQEVPNWGFAAGVAFVGLPSSVRDALIDYLFNLQA